MELQATKQHIAILIDEYGGFSGIVTMEDIIEEIMGDIDDEYDEGDPEIQKVSDDTYLVDGSMDIDDINEELDTKLESETSETIGGFIIDILGEIPDEDDIGKTVRIGAIELRDIIHGRNYETICGYEEACFLFTLRLSSEEGGAAGVLWLSACAL